MHIVDSVSPKWTGRALSVLRIVTALMFMQHGMQKIFGFPQSPGRPPAPYVLFSLLGLAGILELGGGAAMLVGLFTRPVAFLLSGEMAWAYFTVHQPHGFWPIANQGELAALYSFTYLYFVFAGAGPWSLDAIIARAQHEKRARAMATPERRIHPRRKEDRRKTA